MHSAAEQGGWRVLMTGADGAPGPRAMWLERHVVMHAEHAGGRADRYRQSVKIDDLQAGQRGFILKSDLISFVARDITCARTGGEPVTVTQLWGPDDEHCDKKAHCAMHALHRSLALGAYLACIDDLDPLAADDGYTSLHRHDIRHFDRQSHAVAARVLNPRNVQALRALDQKSRRRRPAVRARPRPPLPHLELHVQVCLPRMAVYFYPPPPSSWISRRG